MAVGDFGCGEGRLQLDLEGQGHQGKVHSFDVGKAQDHIIQCDIASVPLKDRELDIGVFCLALMGTNFVDFLKEANRVLKKGGKLFVAEIASRVPDITEFVRLLREELGFKSLKVSKLKDFFYILIFEKEQECKELKQSEALRQILSPCKYKKR
mmetsp:Transcript_38518/g.36889  ORF Transcript_38518/g.36889 Transcript_38518/m.36889 type:complete len:154 (+) Transcript_38518:253-714(+)